MSDFGILAASYVGPSGHGNDLTGLRPWPAEFEDALRNGDLAEMHWSLIFPSDPGRFGRMDLMSRLGLIAVELLDAGLPDLPADERDRTGVCIETRAGSLATDVRFLQTPRASLFAYTLPSTVIGEICIRYRLRGPVLCIVRNDESDPGGLVAAIDWLTQGEADRCVCVFCEAVCRETRTALGGIPGLSDSRWKAGALLLGPLAGGTREHPLESESVCASCCHLLKK